jgi:hypothetical protein
MLTRYAEFLLLIGVWGKNKKNGTPTVLQPNWFSLQTRQGYNRLPEASGFGVQKFDCCIRYANYWLTNAGRTDCSSGAFTIQK